LPLSPCRKLLAGKAAEQEADRRPLGNRYESGRWSDGRTG